MELISAEKDGWDALRRVTFRRDGGCIAVQSRWFRDDIAKDLCSNGRWIIRWNDLDAMEWDHIRHGLAGQRIHDEAHGVTVCPWHHRLSPLWRIDTKGRRERAREVLAALYPDAWAQ